MASSIFSWLENPESHRLAMLLISGLQIGQLISLNFADGKAKGMIHCHQQLAFLRRNLKSHMTSAEPVMLPVSYLI